ncbi:hypothetical protein ACHAXM_006222 [Skeletonema potamos]
MSSLLRSTAAGCNIIRRLQVISAPSSASRALNCYVQSTLGNRFTTIRALSSKETVTITYCDPDGTEHPVEAEIGKHLLDVAHDNNIELEGACGGELACSTCHLVFEQEVYDALPPKTDEEEDMLDLAFQLTETSRLGCQIRVVKEFDGIKVRIPDDGY